MSRSRENVCTSSPQDDPAKTRQRERLRFVKELDFVQAIAEAAGVMYSGILAGCCSDRPARIARIRELITTHKLEARRIFDRRPETFAERFQRLYGEPLSSDPTPSHSLPPTQPELFL